MRDGSPLHLGTRLIALVLIFWALQHWLGAGLAVLLGAPALGLLMARPMLEGGSDLLHQLRSWGFRPIQGHFYSYRGHRLRVEDDEQLERWVAAADIRPFLELPADAVLLRLYPDGTRLNRQQVLLLHEQALLSYLAKATRPDALRFKQWVIKHLARPAKGRRMALMHEAPDTYRRRPVSADALSASTDAAKSPPPCPDSKTGT